MNYRDEKTGQLSFIQPNPKFPKDTKLWREFYEFHDANPHVYEFYKEEIIKAIRSGRELYSIALVTEHNRWNKRIKINNDHKAYYARIFIEEYPEYRSFFKLRKIKTS